MCHNLKLPGYYYANHILYDVTPIRECSIRHSIGMRVSINTMLFFTILTSNDQERRIYTFTLGQLYFFILRIIL